MKQKNIIGMIAIIVLLIVFSYFYTDDKPESNVVKCIAENSRLFVLETCPHCHEQKEILGNDLGLFDVIECTQNRDLCIEENIQSVPAWVIKDKQYTGTKSINDLKKLTGC